MRLMAVSFRPIDRLFLGLESAKDMIRVVFNGIISDCASFSAYP